MAPDMSPTFENPLIAPRTRPLPRRIAVIGSGTIGPDIAYYLQTALPGSTVTLVDVAQTAVDSALVRLRGYADKAVARGKMTREQAESVVAGISGTTDYNAIADCDWVLEAATENLALKRRIMADVEARVRPDAAITSNSSSLPAARIFSEMRHPERATITHFFAPAWRNLVVEVVHWPRVDPSLVEYLRRVFCETGKLPLLSADVPCFMLDRIFDNWCNEAALLLDRATASQVDSVAREYVHMGPFSVLNLANGNPIIIETNSLQADEEGEHYRPAPIFASVDRWHVSPRAEEPVPEVRQAIQDRLRAVYFSQAVDIVDRSIGNPADLNLGCRMALGFKRGPLDLMRDTGNAEVDRSLRRFISERPGMPQPRQSLDAYQQFHRHILVDDLEGVKVITLRRPDALNALDDEMTDEILGVVRQFERDDEVAGFVIVGYGARAFCAGADVGRFPSLLGDANACAQYARDCSRLLVHLDGMSKPVVAALNGMALGGGLELAMRCRALVATRDAWMQFPEINLGIVPGIGALVVPYRRWPAAAAEFHRMLLGAQKMTAARAHELEIVSALFDDVQTLVHGAAERVRKLSARPHRLDGKVAIPLVTGDLVAQAQAGRKLSVEVAAIMANAIANAAAATSLQDALEIGYDAFGRSGCTAAAREGISAFAEGRTPDFGKTG
jgi:enoyl-CoA hydratase/3-hydroxyacyl-CoA dehydrogenase